VEAFHGRALAYEAALEAADPLPPLADALLRNLWRVEPGAEAAAALREGALALAAQAARASRARWRRRTSPPCSGAR
jgi:hypothetical protein